MRESTWIATTAVAKTTNDKNRGGGNRAKLERTPAHYSDIDFDNTITVITISECKSKHIHVHP